MGTYKGTFATGGAVIFQVYGSEPMVFVSGFAASGARGKTELGQACIPMVPPDSPASHFFPVVDHAFSDTEPPHTVSGSFSEPLTATGTYRVTTESWVPPPDQVPPPGQPLGRTCDTGPLSWTASCSQVTPVDCLPAPQGVALLPTGNAFPTYNGSASPARVSRSGQVTLPLRIGCPPPGSNCRVSVVASARIPTSAAVRRKPVRLGRSDYVVKLGASAKTRFRLTTKARNLLRRLIRIKGKAVISVTRGGDIVSRKTVTVRLRAPRQAP